MRRMPAETQNDPLPHSNSVRHVQRDGFHAEKIRMKGERLTASLWCLGIVAIYVYGFDVKAIHAIGCGAFAVLCCVIPFCVIADMGRGE